MQVGRTVGCGHCNPIFSAGLKHAQEMMGKDFKCDCICHDALAVRKEDSHRPQEYYDKNGHLVDRDGGLVFDPDCTECINKASK